MKRKNELYKYSSYYPPGDECHARAIVLLGCFKGTGVEAFSFSSASLGVDVTLSLRLGSLALDSKVELDARRKALETCGAVFAALPRAEGIRGGTGDEFRVPTTEVRRIVDGGTPFPTGLPAIDGAEFVRPEIVPRAPCLRFT